MKAGAKRPGFTLIELLIALTLLAVIAGGMAMAFSTSLQAAGTIQERAALADERRALAARLRADLQGVWVRPGSATTWFRGIAGAGGGSLGATGESDALDLTTARTIAPELLLADPMAHAETMPQSDIAQVVWQLEPDGDGALALTRWERTPPDPEIDITRDPAAAATVFSRFVTGFVIRYFDGVEWFDSWDTAAGEFVAEDEAPMGPPRAVEVTLFAGDRARGRGGDAARGRGGEEAEPWLTILVALPGSGEGIAAVVEDEAPEGAAGEE